MTRHPMRTHGEIAHGLKRTTELHCDALQGVGRRARKQVSKHCSRARKWGISACEELVSNGVFVLSQGAWGFQYFGLQRPHDSLICKEHEGQIVGRGLCWWGGHRLALVRTVLNVEGFESRHRLANAMVEQLRNASLQIPPIN